MQSGTARNSPDVEWLLQSGQASLRTIATYLVKEHYPSLLRLTFALLDEAAAARRLADMTLALALLPGQHYNGDTSVLGWLDGFAVRQWQLAARRRPTQSMERQARVQTEPAWENWTGLEPELRPAFALSALHQLPAPEIALVQCEGGAGRSQPAHDGDRRSAGNDRR